MSSAYQEASTDEPGGSPFRRGWVNISDISDISVVHPPASLDAASAGGFRQALAAAVDTRRPLVLVDMSRVVFLDSAGLGVLLSAHRTLDATQQMALAAVPARLQPVLPGTGLTRLMHVHFSGEPWPWSPLPEPAPSR